MSLLLPDSGLLFWMLISFGLVFFILARYGFPVIVKMVEERRAFIQKSLDDAKAAKSQLDNLKEESDSIISSARLEQVKILNEANQIKEHIISSAKQEAKNISAQMMEETKRELIIERELSIKKVRSQIASLSVEVAEKVVRAELNKTPAHMDMINRLLDESSEMRS
ncbi:MAG: F0F1 ATP synthase subunit B [Bacteroidales bacterium]|jgi:F-type H+-transporting ATPase subunit b